ncbi:MAG: amidohydrolase family protein [Rhodospirillaceae bacterium]|nr:amidohydrolase family protein [Rhodospirillaceae bacterium]
MTRAGWAILLLCAWAAPVLAAAPTAMVIKGTVVTPDAVIPGGWVAIDHGKIISITAAKPALAAARTLETTDIIFPGFVDLHNHPLYNIYPRWTPSHAYHNRYEWRGDEAYLKAIANPHRPMAPGHFCDIDRFVELKELLGGTTTMVGISQPRDTDISCIAGLARNLDWFTGFYGAKVGPERVVNVLGVQPDDVKYAPASLAESLKKGDADLLVIHIAEGQRSDPKTRAEFAELEKQGWLTSRTAVIHGVALTRADFAKMHAAGATLVWSPRSNMELYKETANVADAAAEKVAIALAPDWSPTGSTNMLAELKFAKQVNDGQFKGLFTAKQLFEMASAVPARTARIDDKVGALKPGLYADLFLLHGDAAAPYDALLKASPGDVTLTLVNGVPVSGQGGYLKTLGVAQIEETTLCKAQVAINTAAAGGNLAETSARLGKALTEQGVSLAPVAECD